MNDEVAIKVDHVSKVFRLPHEKQTSLKSLLINFNKRGYEEQLVLDDVSFEIKKGDFFGIVGRNGSGKSTLLKILAGIYRPTSGSVHINGKLTPFIELGVGFNPELTGRENVYLNGALLGFNRKEMNDMYQDIVEFAELERFMDQKLKNYSSGMQVRLAFSIAIRAQTAILLLDEVLAVGDEAFQRKCYRYFSDLKKQKKTVVLVTHDMNTIEEYCDQAMMIHDSVLVAEGEPRKISLLYERANASEEKGSPDDQLPRPSKPPVLLKSIGIRSQKDDTGQFTYKDDILVDVEFSVKKEMDIQFHLGIRRSDDRYMSGINTTEDLKKYRPKKGNHTLTCTIKRRQLAKGEYMPYVEVYTYGERTRPELIDVLSADHGVKIPTIKILGRSPNQNGEFYIQGKWEEP